MRSILAFALICAATIQASAQYPNGFHVDGNELMTWCEPRNAAGPSNPMCIGFVAGVSDAVNFSRQFTGQGSNTSCTPPGVTIGQEADVVLSYLNRNPDKRDRAAAALVVASMLTRRSIRLSYARLLCNEDDDLYEIGGFIENHSRTFSFHKSKRDRDWRVR